MRFDILVGEFCCKQGEKDRAGYGEQLIHNVSKRLENVWKRVFISPIISICAKMGGDLAALLNTVRKS